MENQRLFLKYSKGKHWENHPTIYVEEFAEFLNQECLITCKDSSPGLVIELGCGTGRDVACLMGHFCIPAMGLDIDPYAIQKAKESTGYINDFYVQNIENLPFLNDSQYAYFCINVMHYVDQEKVLGEIYRTLKPGGYAFIHFNLLIVDIDQKLSIDYYQKNSAVYSLVRKFEIVQEKIFMREDSLPVVHTHHVMQVIIKKCR